MKEFIIFVIDGSSSSATPQEMKAIDIFNEKLIATKRWIFAGGLTFPDHAVLIDNKAEKGELHPGGLFDGPENYSGFWIIRAESIEEATELAFEGSLACNRKVELRPLLG